jgi:hypothetical protein
MGTNKAILTLPKKLFLSGNFNEMCQDRVEKLLLNMDGNLLWISINVETGEDGGGLS